MLGVTGRHQTDESELPEFQQEATEYDKAMKMRTRETAKLQLLLTFDYSSLRYYSCKFYTTTQVVHEKMHLKNETCPMMWVSTVSLLNLVTPYYFSIGRCCIVNYHSPCKNGFVEGPNNL